MNTHTPGPWEIYDHSERRVIEPNKGVEILAANAGVIAILYKKNWPNGADEANARLIAAAPDLLVVLKEFAEGRNAINRLSLQEAVDLTERVRAAIAKAEGAIAA